MRPNTKYTKITLALASLLISSIALAQAPPKGSIFDGMSASDAPTRQAPAARTNPADLPAHPDRTGHYDSCEGYNQRLGTSAASGEINRRDRSLPPSEPDATPQRAPVPMELPILPGTSINVSREHIIKLEGCPIAHSNYTSRRPTPGLPIVHNIRCNPSSKYPSTPALNYHATIFGYPSELRYVQSLHYPLSDRVEIAFSVPTSSGSPTDPHAHFLKLEEAISKKLGAPQERGLRVMAKAAKNKYTSTTINRAIARQAAFPEASWRHNGLDYTLVAMTFIDPNEFGYMVALLTISSNPTDRLDLLEGYPPEYLPKLLPMP